MLVERRHLADLRDYPKHRSQLTRLGLIDGIVEQSTTDSLALDSWVNIESKDLSDLSTIRQRRLLQTNVPENRVAIECHPSTERIGALQPNHRISGPIRRIRVLRIDRRQHFNALWEMGCMANVDDKGHAFHGTVTTARTPLMTSHYQTSYLPTVAGLATLGLTNWA